MSHIFDIIYDETKLKEYGDDFMTVSYDDMVDFLKFDTSYIDDWNMLYQEFQLNPRITHIPCIAGGFWRRVLSGEKMDNFGGDVDIYFISFKEVDHTLTPLIDDIPIGLSESMNIVAERLCMYYCVDYTDDMLHRAKKSKNVIIDADIPIQIITRKLYYGDFYPNFWKSASLDDNFRYSDHNTYIIKKFDAHCNRISFDPISKTFIMSPYALYDIKNKIYRPELSSLCMNPNPQSVLGRLIKFSNMGFIMSDDALVNASKAVISLQNKFDTVNIYDT